MNIGLVHPYLSYLLYFVILTGLISWIGDFIKIKNDSITLVVIITNILSLIGFSIINCHTILLKLNLKATSPQGNSPRNSAPGNSPTTGFGPCSIFLRHVGSFLLVLY